MGRLHVETHAVHQVLILPCRCCTRSSASLTAAARRALCSGTFICMPTWAQVRLPKGVVFGHDIDVRIILFLGQSQVGLLLLCPSPYGVQISPPRADGCFLQGFDRRQPHHNRELHGRWQQCEVGRQVQERIDSCDRNAAIPSQFCRSALRRGQFNVGLQHVLFCGLAGFVLGRRGSSRTG